MRPTRPRRLGGRTLAAIATVLGLNSAFHPPARAGDLDASSWSARVDAPARPLAAPTDLGFTIAFPGNFGNGGEATYPAVPSPFVAIGKNFFPNDVRQVWDLSARKQVGQFKGPLGLDDRTVALSGDGAYLAGKVTSRQAVEVRRARDGRVERSFDADGPFVDFVEFAGDDRVMFGKLGNRSLQVGDIKSGDKVCDLRLGERVEREAVAISPGGAYLASASTGDGRLRLHDLKTGREVAEAPTPRARNMVARCAGLAFAPDGTELAGLFESFGSFQLVCWDAATGKASAQFDLAKAVQRPTFYKDQGVAYAPDKSTLLVLGYAVIDRASGKKVWGLPFDEKDLKVGPRHFLDAGHAVVVSSSPGLSLRAVELPRDRIAAAATIAREGGNAADAALPPLRSVDLASARRVPVEGKAGLWSVPAPAPSAGPRRLVARPIALKNKAEEARALLFAGAGSTQVAVAGTASKPGAADPSDGQPRWVERFDLAGARALGSIELPGPAEPIALAPDGSAVLTREAGAKDRLDVYAAFGKPVAGWRPFEKGSGADRVILWADFLDPVRVAVLGGGGTLAVFSVPDLKVLYVVDDAFLGAPTLSPDRSLLAGSDGKTLRVLDAATGALLGEGQAPTGLAPLPEWKGGAFRPDGTAVVGQFGNDVLVSWEMATGKLGGTAKAARAFPAGRVEWLGDHRVLLDNRTLVDFRTGRVVWEYAGAPVGAGGPDGRHWFAARGATGQDAGGLRSIDPDNAALDKAEARMLDAAAPAVLRPGAKVSIQVDGSGPPGDAAGYRKALEEALGGRLRAGGMNVVAAGADVRLVLAVRERDTGQTIQFQPFGRIRGPVEVVKLVDLVCELTLNDAAGAVPCGAAYAAPMRPFGFVLRMPAGQDKAEPYLKQLQWDRIKAWASNAVLPYFVARDGAEVLRLPGYTDLNRPK